MRFRAALPHQLDGPRPTPADVPAYIERVEEQEVEIERLRFALQHARSVMVQSQHRNDAAMMDALRQVEAALA
jgi:hypothetical protein